MAVSVAVAMVSVSSLSNSTDGYAVRVTTLFDIEVIVGVFAAQSGTSRGRGNSAECKPCINVAMVDMVMQMVMFVFDDGFLNNGIGVSDQGAAICVPEEGVGAGVGRSNGRKTVVSNR
jgi:hypothetical protein